MSQSEYEAITSNRRKARENARVQVVIGFGFHWLKKWHKVSWPITEQSNAKPMKTQFTFFAELKIALMIISRSQKLDPVTPQVTPIFSHS